MADQVVKPHPPVVAVCPDCGQDPPAYTNIFATPGSMHGEWVLKHICPHHKKSIVTFVLNTGGGVTGPNILFVDRVYIREGKDNSVVHYLTRHPQEGGFVEGGTFG